MPNGHPHLPAGANMFGMPDTQGMPALPQLRQQQAMASRMQQQDSVPMMQNCTPGLPQQCQQNQFGGRTPGLQQTPSQFGMTGMFPMQQQQHFQQSSNCGQSPQYMQGMQHMQHGNQCLQTTPTPPTSHPLQSACGMQNIPAMQSTFGEASATCNYQLMALPAGVAPPEGAIPAGSMLSGAITPQAPLQHNSQWNPPQNNSKRWRIVDPKTGDDVQFDTHQDETDKFTRTSWDWPLGRQEVKDRLNRIDHLQSGSDAAF